MRVLLIDGHPDRDRLSSHLLDAYQQALPDSVATDRITLRDLRFDPILHRGYAEEQALEPDLQRATQALLDADHIVIAHPMWWGAEPALLKGFYDRVLLPGTTFRYHQRGPFWDGLLRGRSADVLVTLDTPEFWLRLRFGNPLGNRLKHQVLGFCGVKPVRMAYLGPVRRGGVDKNLGKWRARVAAMAREAPALKRGKRRA